MSSLSPDRVTTLATFALVIRAGFGGRRSSLRVNRDEAAVFGPCSNTSVAGGTDLLILIRTATETCARPKHLRLPLFTRRSSLRQGAGPSRLSFAPVLGFAKPAPIRGPQ